MPDHSSVDSAETQRLLMRLSSGDRDAFNDLFERHRKDLRRMIQLRLDRQLRARVDASDIVQEAQFEAFCRLDDYLDAGRCPLASGCVNSSRANPQSPPRPLANRAAFRPSRGTRFRISLR